MRLASVLLVVAALLGTPRFCLADETDKPAADNRLAELAAQCDNLFVRGKAFACVVISGENSSTTTFYNSTPYLRAPDGSYASQTSWSVVSRIKGQVTANQFYKQTDRIQWEGNKPVSVSEGDNYTGRPQDLIQSGNGIIYRVRNPAQGDISQTDYLRRGDGAVIGIQRYLGLTAVVLWEEVPVPPDLQRGPAQPISSTQSLPSVARLRQ